MKQKLLMLRLALILATMFFKEFYRISKEEIKNPSLYPQENYNSCLDRATAIIRDAAKKPITYYAFAIAHHRDVEHNENRSDEKYALRNDLSTKEQKSATRGFWLG